MVHVSVELLQKGHIMVVVPYILWASWLVWYKAWVNFTMHSWVTHLCVTMAWL